MIKDKMFHPHENDVLCARGKLAMNWPGNAFYNDLIKHSRREYHSGDNSTKNQLATGLVHQIRSRSPPGRFLKIIDNDWIELEHGLAIRKTRQALREGAKHPITDVSRHMKNHMASKKCQSHVKFNGIAAASFSKNIAPADALCCAKDGSNEGEQ